MNMCILYRSTKPMPILFLLLFVLLCSSILLLNAAESSTSSSKPAECPVCLRVLRASRDLTKQDKSGTLSVPEALAKYCQLQNIPVEDQQFCYNIDTMLKDLSRLISLGATDNRICKRIKSTNPHFCSTKLNNNAKKADSTSKKLAHGAKKGIIYI